MGDIMDAPISAEILESHLRCKYKAYLLLSGESGSKADFEIQSTSTRDALKSKTIEATIGKNGAGQVITDCLLSPSVLKRSASYIFNCTVHSEQLHLKFDGIKLAPGLSKLGSLLYLPLLFERPQLDMAHHRLLLNLFSKVLGTVQGAEPNWGCVYRKNGTTQRVRLGTNDVLTRRVFAELRAVQSCKTIPSLILNRHCDVCEFRVRCRSEATSKDEVSLLRTLSASEIKSLTRRGISTLTQLSCTFRPRRGGKHTNTTRTRRLHAVQALAIREKKIHIVGAPSIATSGDRIFLDLEGDMDRRFGYLIGMIIECAGATEHYSLWADSPTEEERIFAEFRQIIDRTSNCPIFAYGSYETAFVKRLCKADDRREAGEQICSRLVNVLNIVHHHFYFPTYSNGLKDIAGYLGFRWTETSASGIQSFVWRSKWEETGELIYKQKLIQYNLEDCAALKVLTDVLTTLCHEPVHSAEHSYAFARLDDEPLHSSRRSWCNAIFENSDFAYVNNCARFDYQHDKIYVRTGDVKKKQKPRKKNPKRKRRINRTIEIASPTCIYCGGSTIVTKPDGRCRRIASD